MHATPVQATSGWTLLRRYERGWLRPDVVAGLTVGAMLVPQSMAYAELAGVPAATGVAAVAGASPDPVRDLALMAALALLVAAIAGAAWILRLGFIATVLSKPVLVGYITGVGLVLVSSQLQAFTGVPIDAGEFVPRIGQLVARLSEARLSTLLLGGGALAVIVVLRRVAPQLPGALIAVAGATLVTALLDLPAAGEPTIGAIPAGLPTPSVPDVSFADLRALLPAALGVALVGTATTC